jgi:hypothetical protein
MHSPAVIRFLAIALLVLLAVTGCADDVAAPATKSYTYTLPDTPGGRQCTNQCREAQDYCHQDCDLTYRDCVGKVQVQALQDYDRYTRDQFANHQAIELQPHNFERTTACDEAKKTCMTACEPPYQSCFQSCGGKVNVTTSCQYMCF